VIFTVILPTIGRDSLTDAIESVRAQVYQDWELVVVLDNCAFQIPRIGHHDFDPRIIYTPTSGPPDFGARARNEGIKRSSQGQWIAYIDDDDVWGSYHLSTHADLIQRHAGINMLRTAGQSFTMGHKSPRHKELVKKPGVFNFKDILTVGMSHSRELFEKTNGWQPHDNHDRRLWKDMLAVGGNAHESQLITFQFKR
jgi:glycosyltransferase involved in cell wall biosynthesis